MQRNPARSYLLSPFTLAALLAVVIIIFLPDLFTKYRVELIETAKTKHIDEIDVYTDLNFDNNSDKILSFLAPQGFHCIQIFDHEDGLIDQWNLDGILPGNNARLLTGDYNRDGIKEVFTFSQSNDSLFLYMIRPVEQSPFLIKHRFIAALDRLKENPEYSVSNLHLFDMNKDGYDDLIFIVSSGFSLQPREIYIYSIPHDSLVSSEPAGSIIGDIKFTDLDGDGYPEIIGNSGSSGNIGDSLNIPFSDYSAWLQVFDHHLSYVFPPVEFPGLHSNINVQPFYYNDAPSILTLYNHRGSLDNYPVLSVYGQDGNMITAREFEKSPKYQVYLLKDANNEIWLINDQGQFHNVSPSLEFRRVLDLRSQIIVQPLALDIDEDQETEYVVFKTDITEAYIFRDGFRDKTGVTLPDPGVYKERSYAVIKSTTSGRSFFVQHGKNTGVYKYGKNPLYLLKYPVFLGIYLAALALVLLIRKIQRIQIRDKLLLQNQISELQLKTVNNQLDPHFTLNAFNAIASLLKKEKGEKAYSYFIKFSNLVRSNLVSADQISRSLEDEINIVRNYLDIQQLRFNHRFDYEIRVDEAVDKTWRIPKMAIQNYIENAVKHGFKELTGSGKLLVEIKKNNHHITIRITDNGIGREKAKAHQSDSTGLGMEIMHHYFSLLNKYNAVKITQEILDLHHPEGTPAGTMVIVEIPIDIDYNLSKYV